MALFSYDLRVGRQVFVKRVHPDAKLPERAHKEDAGYDLWSTVTARILPMSREVIPTGIQMVMPYEWYGRIASRSGLSAKNHIEVGAGVIDPGYRGEIKVVLINMHTSDPFDVKPGMKIAQIIFEHYMSPSIHEVADLSVADEKVVATPLARGEKGFGSTGL